MNLRHLPIPFLFDPTLSQDVYAQVGYVMLIGLASKSAILIVEFANQQLRDGRDRRAGGAARRPRRGFARF